MDWTGIAGEWWRLRRPTWADEPAIAEHGRGPEPRWIGIGPSSPPERAHEVTQQFVKGATGDFGLVHLAVHQESGAILAMIGAQEHPPDSARAGTVEIVYGVAPAWRGRGLATEILTRVAHEAQEQGESRPLELVIAAQNAASIRVAEKSGFRFVGTRSTYVEGTGQTYDDLVYVPSWQR